MKLIKLIFLIIFNSLLFLGLIEGFLRLLDAPKNHYFVSLKSEGKTIPEIPDNQFDREVAKVLGHYIKSNRTYRHIKKYQGKPLYDVEYKIDAKGRRTIGGNSPEYQRAIALFGGSFAFGEGVSDNSTLIGHLKKQLPRTNFYNYAQRGGAVGESLLWIDKIIQPADLPEKKKDALFLLTDFSLLRIHNSMSHVAKNGGNSPYFYRLPDGRLYGGRPFNESFPIQTKIYYWVYQSLLVQRLKLDYPLVYGHFKDHHYSLLVEIFKRASLRLKERHGFDRVVAVIYPSFHDMAPLVVQLQQNQIITLDYSTLYGNDMEVWERHRIPYDHHPNSLGFARLAQKIVDDLALIE